MKHLLTMVCIIAMALLFSAPIYSQDDAASDSLIGTISTIKGSAAEVIGANLQAETYDENDNIVTISYSVVMDENGKEIAEKFDGKEIQVIGTIAESTDGSAKSSITIASYEAIADEDFSEPTEDATDTEAPDVDVSYEEAPEEGTMESTNN